VTLRIEVVATDGEARTGTITTARGSFGTPCFMPVGTRGAVRTLSSADLEDLGAEIVLANTYHLMLRPGADVVARLGGLHGFMAWSGHLLTDSGGYQVFSLSPEVDDDGVTFRSTYDGTTHRLTPEGAVAVQEQLGADIQMVLDVCPPLPAPPEVIRTAVDRTAVWAARARKAHRREGQAGLSVGESRAEMLDALDACVGGLPSDRPRYLMGVGDPVGLAEAVARGIDLFDCVLPTRLARHGTVLTAAGRLSLRSAACREDDAPLDPSCPCPVCARWSRGYLRHLQMTGEPGSARLVTIHNVSWILALVQRLRTAVEAGTLATLRTELAEVWCRDEKGPR